MVANGGEGCDIKKRGGVRGQNVRTGQRVGCEQPRANNVGHHVSAMAGGEDTALERGSERSKAVPQCQCAI